MTDPPLNAVQAALADAARTSILTRDLQTATVGDNLEAALVAAEDALRTSPAAGFGQSERENRELLRRHQKQCLAQAAENRELPGRFVADEGEHLVHYDQEASLAHKATNNQRYGLVLDQDDFRPDRRIGARPALPSEYLWRLGLQNVLFEDRIRLAAIGSTIYGTPSIHTTQPWLNGAAPEIETARAFMVALGFRNLPRQMLVPGTPAVLCWYRPSDGILAYDTKPANFVQVDRFVVPIDLSLAMFPMQLFEETAQLNGIEWQEWLDAASAAH